MSLPVSQRAITVALAIVMGLPAGVAGQAMASRHPADTAAAIRMARATFQEAERAVARHTWVRHDTTVTCGDEEPEIEVTLDRDRRGVVRRLEWGGGSDDHAERHRYFYDADGRQRFAFRTLGAVNGTRYEERVYYGEDGEEVRHFTRIVTGPGYPFEREKGVPDPLAWVRAICE